MVRQVFLFVTGNHEITVAQAIYKWAPPTENNSAGYLNFILNGNPKANVTGLGCSSDTLWSEALKIPGIGAYADEPND